MILGLRLYVSKTCKNLLVESWIIPKFPVIANFKRSTGEFFVLLKRKRSEIFRPNRYVGLNASFERPILEQFMGKCCLNVSCLDRRSKLRHFFNGDLPLNNEIEVFYCFKQQNTKSEYSVVYQMQKVALYRLIQCHKAELTV